MTEAQTKKLRGFYHSLLGQQRVFDDAASKNQIVIANEPVDLLNDEISRVEKEFPNLLPPFRCQDYFSRDSTSGSYYKLAGIRSYLGMILGRLKIAVETATESAPVTETREFTFVKNLELRKIIERDYVEVQQAYIAKCWKSVIILSGSLIEAVLADLVLQNADRSRAATKAPRDADIRKWDLADLINVSVELGLVSAGVEKLSHPVREYRNLVHPGNEIRNKLTLDAEEAKIAIEVLHIVHRDLSK